MFRYVVIVGTLSFLLYNYAPSLDFEPQPYTPQLLKFEGPLAVNQDLNKGQIILEGQLPAPTESLTYKDGLIYASVMDGRIVTIKDDKTVRIVVDTTEGSKVASVPLGLRFHNDDLYVTDEQRGLLKVDVKTGRVTVLISNGDHIGGKALSFANDLDIVDGVVYFSDVSTSWRKNLNWFTMVEHTNTGRVCTYDIATGRSGVVLDNLYMPNGIQGTPDKKSVLIAETANQRILRYYISGPSKGRTEVFAQLPGEPDNLRLSSRGGYWVPLISSSDVSSPSWINRLSPYPSAVKVLCKLYYALGSWLEWANQYISSSQLGNLASELKTGMIVLRLFNMEHPIVVELSAEGKVLRSFHSNTAKLGKLSQGLEVDGYLYLGSFANPYILKIKI